MQFCLSMGKSASFKNGSNIMCDNIIDKESVPSNIVGLQKHLFVPDIASEFY